MLLQLEVSLIAMGKTRRKIKPLTPRKSKAGKPFPISRLRLAVQQQRRQQQQQQQQQKKKKSKVSKLRLAVQQQRQQQLVAGGGGDDDDDAQPDGGGGGGDDDDDGEDEFSAASFALSVLENSGVRTYLRSTAGGALRGHNLTNCLKHAVSLAQYVYEKVSGRRQI